MPGASSRDRRRRPTPDRPSAGRGPRRVVAAALAGDRFKDTVARCYAVGRSTVDRWIEAALVEGRLEAKPMQGGPKPTIREESATALRGLVATDHHRTLAADRDRLAAATGVRVHPWTVGRAFTAPRADAPKRRACARPSGTGPRSTRSVRPGVRRPPASAGSSSAFSTRVPRSPTSTAPMVGAPAASGPMAPSRAAAGSASPSWARSGLRESSGP
jgi:transposase